MIKKIAATLLCSGFAITATFAQQQKIPDVPPPRVELRFENPIDREQSVRYTERTPVQLDAIDKTVLSRIAEIKQYTLASIQAQINDDLVEAEDALTTALEKTQLLIEDYPDVQSSRRFNEMYRSVMAEYHEFYGISGPVNVVEGDVFDFRDELFAVDEWFDGSYFAMPASFDEDRFDVPLIINRQVNNQIHFLTERRPQVMRNWLNRSTYYFPMMRRIFDEVGVPQELIHLSMIESGLIPTARSHMRAVGLWQFIYATGAAYGLEVNWWIDERRDPEKATRAAARHLRDLYEVWGDWHMVLADYNASTRSIRRAINLSGGSRDYWTIFPHLPRETRGYVPSYIAATLIALNPEDFGFERPVPGDVYEYDVAEVTGSIELSVLAEFAGITTQELRSLNPELLRFATPPGPRPYPLKIPKGSRDKFLAAYENMPESLRQTLVVHTVSRGETLGAIANRYGVTVRGLYSANDNLSSLIHPGQEIIIPVPGGSNVAISPDNPSNARQARTLSASAGRSTVSAAPAPSGMATLNYTVKSGDTVGHIAEWYGTSAANVRSWNNIGNNIRVGQRLTVHVPANQRDYFLAVNDMNRTQKQAMMRERNRNGIPTNQIAASGQVINYTVRRGDNLHNIARANNTSVNAIMRQNNLSSSNIRIGQQLQIPVGQ